MKPSERACLLTALEYLEFRTGNKFSYSGRDRKNCAVRNCGHAVDLALMIAGESCVSRKGIKYTERLAEAGIEPSVGSVGDSYDNALAVTINGLYEAEVIHRRGPWRSFEAVEFATLEWVDWFSHRRLLELIGNVPPAEAEQRYFAMLEQPKIAA
jgi:hypothetical protein